MEIQKKEIQKFLKIINKRSHLFIILSLSIMSVIVWGSYLLPKQYEASSTVFIEHNVIKELVKGIAISPSMENSIKALKFGMLSRGLITKVIKDLDLDAKLGNGKKMEAMITEFQEKTQIMVKGQDLFIISIRNGNPKIAKDYINDLVTRYVEESTSQKREESYGATKFLGEQLVDLKEKLVKAEEAVNKYRFEKGVYLEADDKTIIEEIRNYKKEMEAIQVRKNELIATGDSIKRQLQGEEPFTVSVYKRPDSSVKGSSFSLPSLESTRDQLLQRYTENYPEVIKLNAQIESLKKKQASMPQKSGSDNLTEPETSSINPVFMDLRQKKYSTESELSSLEAKQKQLAAMAGARERELRQFPESKKRLSELEGERDNIKELYTKLSAREGQSEVSKQMEVQDKSTTFRIVDPAVLPIKPASPDRIKLILIGIVVGLAGGFGGVFIRESFDSSVKEVQTLKDLGLSVIGVIPRIFSEGEEKEKAKKERRVYAFAVSYFLVICSTLLLEAMGLSYIDAIIAGIRR